MCRQQESLDQVAYESRKLGVALREACHQFCRDNDIVNNPATAAYLPDTEETPTIKDLLEQLMGVKGVHDDGNASN